MGVPGHFPHSVPKSKASRAEWLPVLTTHTQDGPSLVVSRVATAWEATPRWYMDTVGPAEPGRAQGQMDIVMWGLQWTGSVTYGQF